MSAALSSAHAEVVPVSNLAAALSTGVAGISAQISTAVSTAHAETFQVGNLAISLSSTVAANSGAISVAVSTANSEMAQISSLTCVVACPPKLIRHSISEPRSRARNYLAVTMYNNPQLASFASPKTV